jgi:CRISPR/Cas system Type II protein with McrA/HNH and RuvC-like nuclease domain
MILKIVILLVIFSGCNSRKISSSSSSSSEEEVNQNEIIDRCTKFQYSSLESDDDDVITSKFTDGSAEETENDDNVEILQGDILMTKKQKEKWIKNLDDGESVSEEYETSRKGILDLDYRWPKDEDELVMIPYEFSEKSRFSKLKSFPFSLYLFLI